MSISIFVSISVWLFVSISIFVSISVWLFVSIDVAESLALTYEKKRTLTYLVKEVATDNVKPHDDGQEDDGRRGDAALFSLSCVGGSSSSIHCPFPARGDGAIVQGQDSRVP